jgi:SpoVK/Ycf46/Vps4 family AAA+-type ATPase
MSRTTDEFLKGIPAKEDVSGEDFEENVKTLDDYLDELNRLVGLEKVKKDVNSLINLVQIRKLRQDRGIKQPPMSLHLVFSGNPGTGKTTVARLLSEIYHEIGLLSKGHLVETDRSGLVGGYVGQTALKTQEVLQSAMGGILFIDEAYALAQTSENDYGKEAIDTILKAMEDNRDDLIVIVAGYPELMDRFLHSNPGLESRFNKFIYFEDYSASELYEIFWLMCDEANLTIDKAGDEYIKQYFELMYENKSSNFANGRAVRNFFEEVITAQANRLASQSEITDEELNTLIYEDFLVDEE